MIARATWRSWESLRPRGVDKPVLVVFGTYVVFTLLFGLVVPWSTSAGHGIRFVPQDFFPMPQRGGDYVATYAAANRVLLGHPIYDQTVFEEAATDPYARLYSYPPLHVYAFVPLASLPPAQSYQVWMLITVALIAASCLMAALLTEAPLLSFVALALMYAQSSFFQFQLERGQTDAPTLFLMTAMVYFYARRRSLYVAAACLALGALIKALPVAFVLFFLLRREFRLLAASGVIAVVLVLATGIENWITYVTRVVPSYSAYFLGQNVDHSLYYLFEGVTHNLPRALTLARAAVGVLLLMYAALVLRNQHRSRLLLVELAIFTTIIEIATPWSANYKLILLVFLYLSPMAVLQIQRVRERPLLYTLPLFLAFVLIVPIYGDYVTRLPYSLLAHVLPGPVIIANPLHPFITDRKVVLGLLFCIVYLSGLYAMAAPWPSAMTRWLGAWSLWARAHRNTVRIGLGVAVTVAIAIGVLRVAAAYERAQAAALTMRTAIDQEVRINDAVGLAGYSIRYDRPAHYTVSVLYHVYGDLPDNLQVYVHADTKDASGKTISTMGRNFFPSVVTSLWPTGKYVVATTDSYFEPTQYSLRVGLIDGAVDQQFGEATLGPVTFPAQ